MLKMMDFASGMNFDEFATFEKAKTIHQMDQIYQKRRRTINPRDQTLPNDLTSSFDEIEDHEVLREEIDREMTMLLAE